LVWLQVRTHAQQGVHNYRKHTTSTFTFTSYMRCHGTAAALP
jgi:hypothetical protein